MKVFYNFPQILQLKNVYTNEEMAVPLEAKPGYQLKKL